MSDLKLGNYKDKLLFFVLELPQTKTAVPNGTDL